jgi:pathogenesis-related protein 1
MTHSPLVRVAIAALATLPLAAAQPLAAQTSATEAQQMLTAHNQWRSRYKVPALTWSPQLANYAQEWANKLVRENRFQHRPNPRYGENLAWASGQRLRPSQVVNMWGNEVKDYNYASNTCKPGAMCGHYTQIVWRDSKQVGCGVARGNGQEIWVCNYNPPGNYIGRKPY